MFETAGEVLSSVRLGEMETIDKEIPQVGREESVEAGEEQGVVVEEGNNLLDGVKMRESAVGGH